ncbi:MAG: SH3 domain-containing protein [Candidatus Riflebacteria bacterium]|nr:SH3 domain-containing protein [Candidatus Riflebacteria bacterium]
MHRRFRLWVWLIAACSVISFSAGPLAAGDSPFSGADVTPQNNSGNTSGQTALSPQLSADAQDDGVVEVRTSLNIRSGPWGDIIGSFKNGDHVKIIGSVGDWYKISYNGRIAYVYSKYIRRSGQTQAQAPQHGWINAATGVQVQSTPGGGVIGALKDQREIDIIGQSGDYYKIKFGDKEAYVPRRYVDLNVPTGPSNGQVESVNFTGFVTADIGLNVRKSPWGPIETTLSHGSTVQITGKVGDWYRINYNGQERYVQANYIDQQKPGSTTPGSSDGVPAASLQAGIAAEARKLIGSTRFRTADVSYGNLACAKVVSTALVNAGAIPQVELNVRTLVSDLHAKGWQDVQVPPYQEGDVITWMTYDYNHDGQKDPDTHVGIIVKEGNSFMAMNNSSRLRTPRLSEPTSIGPVSRVMRKVA